MTATCSTVDFPFGPLRITATEAAITAITLAQGPAPCPPGDHALHQEAQRQLRAWLAGDRRDFDLPLAPEGTTFQRAVWAELVAIPFGETRTYGQLAARLGRPSASRAVGAANGRNPLAIVVPCHRVIGRDGSLTGYAWGLPMKAWLLAHERGADAAHLGSAA